MLEKRKIILPIYKIIFARYSLNTYFAGGATTVPLSTAETILLAFFKKRYTKEIKKEEHLNPLCREMKIKNFKAKDKAELIIILAKELLLKKRVVLKKDADFYCLHKESISIK